MRVRRSALPLPRYTRRKRLKKGGVGYFFDVPTWARERVAQSRMNRLVPTMTRLCSVRKNSCCPRSIAGGQGSEDASPVGIGVVAGTFDWMFHEYRRTWSQKTAKRLRPFSPGQCRVHETGIKMICEYLLKDGRRLERDVCRASTPHLSTNCSRSSSTRTVNGEKIERRTTVNHAMKTARGAWNTVSRANPGLFPPRNPFEKMGLQSNSRETPHANFAELKAFRAKAIEMGHPSLATGALIGWEWLQREAHIFIRFVAEHYRPPDRPSHVYVINYKTSTGSWEPLFNAKGNALYPLLMAELDAIKKLRPTGGLMLRRDGSSLPWFGKGEILTQVQRISKKIILAAGLRPELTFTSFGRHGGTTEANSSGLTTFQLMEKGQWSS